MPRRSWSERKGSRFAWGISRPFGLTSDATVGFGEAVNRSSENEVFFRGGVALSFDLSAVSSVPMGFAASLLYDTFPEGGEDITGGLGELSLRIAYNGREDFIIALDTGVESIKIDGQEDRVKFGSTTVSLRYYF